MHVLTCFHKIIFSLFMNTCKGKTLLFKCFVKRDKDFLLPEIGGKGRIKNTI